MAFSSWEWEPGPKHRALEGLQYIAAHIALICATCLVGAVVFVWIAAVALCMYVFAGGSL